LLGAAPEVIVFKATIDAVWGMWIHANIDVRTGALQFVINGPEMHRWHHSDELEMPGKNFSTKIALWDWVFGTAYLPAHKPKSYGLGGENFPIKAYHETPQPGVWSRFNYIVMVCLADIWVYLKQVVALFRPLSRDADQTRMSP
ncbi:MAG: sterol desaturase family protein, partial [Myxococcota bacterium]